MEPAARAIRWLRHPAVLAIMLGILGAWLPGCGKATPVGSVRGKVLFNGAPYANASVVFLSPTTGNGASADIQPGGTFTLPSPLKVGKYTVFLAPKSEPETGGQPQSVSIDQSVPDKYWNEASSDVSIEVKEGENDVVVKLGQ